MSAGCIDIWSLRFGIYLVPGSCDLGFLSVIWVN